MEPQTRALHCTVQRIHVCTESATHSRAGSALSRALTTQLESTDDGRKNGASLEPPISWARVLCLQLKHPELKSESMLQWQVVLDQVIPVVLSCFLQLVSAKMDLLCPCLVLQLLSHYRFSKYFLPLWAYLPLPPYRPKAFSTSPKEGTSQLGSLPANPAQGKVKATMSPHCRDIWTSPVGAVVTPLPSYIPCSLSIIPNHLLLDSQKAKVKLKTKHPSC